MENVLGGVYIMLHRGRRQLAILLMAFTFLVGSMPAIHAYAASEEDDKKQESVKEIDENNRDSDNKLLKTQIITIKGSNFVADTLNGVEALYRTGGNDGSNATYSCAAYIKRYYKENFGVSVNNLFGGRTPNASKGNFRSVKKPQVGDVVACSSTSGSNHWAVVKKINNNNTVTLIEQNWKWSQGGQTLCKINRSISVASAKFYRLNQ
ncbi:CHAP domain-containing protein [Lachnospiraceae bacterium WCA-693-APC-MOT-I]|uniref:CHAP domain-containing protein n=2 Tax=Velocimicrobium porci TaxID=2606634 RepID=A0A6L5XWN6_9FIRM|nr:CHAP domain-containing protein [Velocimicrobium porci]